MLTCEESLAFLLARTNRQHTIEAEQRAATTLTEELGGLPLALEQAGAYIANKEARFNDYLQAYRKRKLELLDSHPPETGDYDKTVATAWSLNFEAVTHESQAAGDVLSIVPFLSPEPIPEEVLIKGASEFGEHVQAYLSDYSTNPLRVDELLEPLLKYSLIQRNAEARTFQMHRLISVSYIYGLEADMRVAHAAKAVCVIAQALPIPEIEFYPTYDPFVPHALDCAKYVLNLKFDFFKAIELVQAIARFIKWEGYYSIAEDLYIFLLNHARD